jgi:hypothetical protein
MGNGFHNGITRASKILHWVRHFSQNTKRLTRPVLALFSEDTVIIGIPPSCLTVFCLSPILFCGSEYFQT